MVPSTIAADWPLETMWPANVARWPGASVEVPMMMPPLEPLTMELPATSTGVVVGGVAGA